MLLKVPQNLNQSSQINTFNPDNNTIEKLDSMAACITAAITYRQRKPT